MATATVSSGLVGTVKELIELADSKKSANHTAYEAVKAFDAMYDRAAEMLRRGQTIPQGSMYFARLENSARGVANPSLVIQEIVKRHPAVARLIPEYESRVRDELVERLAYGVLPRKH